MKKGNKKNGKRYLYIFNRRTKKDIKIKNAHEDGRGISAVQIGVLKTVCYITWGGKEIVMINPKITRTRGEKEFVEGCLSAPTILKKVKRAQKVWCTYLDENWEEQEIAEGGRMSNIIQHELDHFEGKCKVAEEN